MNRKQLPYYYSAGGERLETAERMRKASCPVVTTRPRLTHCGAPMTTGAYANEYYTTAEELHTFVIGETGSGKTRRVVMPMIRLAAKTGESMIISDPKGELYRETAADLRQKGYTVQVINLREPAKSARWNPLAEIERLFRSEDADERDRSVAELKTVADELSHSIDSQKDPFWSTVFEQMFLGIARIVLEYGAKGMLTFDNIERCAAGLYQSLSLSHKAFAEWWKDIPQTSLIRTGLTAFLTANSGQRNTHMNVFYAALARFTNQESLRAVFAGSDFSLSSLAKRSSALFIIVPDESEVMYYISTLLIRQIYESLVKLADSRPDGALPVHTHFILDEFANFSEMPSMSSMLTASRSRGIRFTLVCQSMEQLFAKYGDAGAETLMANCRVWIYMNCRNLPFLNRLSALGGEYYNAETDTRFPLLTVPELTHLGAGEVIVFNDRCRPYRGYLPDIDTCDFGDGKALPKAVLTVRKRRPPKAFRFEDLLPEVPPDKPRSIHDIMS